VRGTVLGFVVWLAAAGCTALGTPAPADDQGPAFLVEATQQPLVRVTAGPVTGLVPEGWTAIPFEGTDPREGFLASPQPGHWHWTDGAVPGFAATWVDATAIGVPSDMYYLAATGPVLSNLVTAPSCRVVRRSVIADHVPALADGAPNSPGDFMIRAHGVCRPQGEPMTRWSYFVAAPGYGPAMGVGIPGSGLYVAVAVTRDSPKATERLTRLLASVRFGDASLSNLVRVARTELP
jgi:hypothetical protein